jgi:exosortase A-associated hydrolase 2
MSVVDRAVVRPVVLHGGCGRLFAVYVAPAGVRPVCSTATLYIPPFTEELNRSRRMASLQARAFAAKGVSTLLLDPFGTGDSEGDFSDARLSGWIADISAAAAWLEQAGYTRLVLWGLRFGGLLACVAATNDPGRFRRVILWQPITSGHSMLTQFLRIRVAGSMSGARETTKDLRDRLMSGRSVEVAGYELSASLASALDGLQMDGLSVAPDTRIHWFEVAAESDGRMGASTQRIIDHWRRRGIAVSTAMVSGAPFWATQETTVVPELLTATTATLLEGAV